MKFVKIDPPGTFCFYEAVLDCIKQNIKGDELSFVEIGCGAGDLSKILLARGYRGIGVDYSEQALQIAEANLKPFIDSGRYHLALGDLMTMDPTSISNEKTDLALSMMVMEHVQEDFQFIQKLSRLVKPNGHIMIAVPGRKDCWNFEDETVGHLRRYDRSDLEKLMKDSNLDRVKVWSVAVPTANLLLRMSAFVIRRSGEKKKMSLSSRVQTQTSGIREIPFKTIFPNFFRLILNRVTLYPLFLIQRLFYNSSLGVTMLGIGTVKETNANGH